MVADGSTPAATPPSATTAQLPTVPAGVVDTSQGQLLDLRGLAKPRYFNGEEQQWCEWRFRFENWSALLGIDKYLADCVLEGVIIPDLSLMDDAMRKVSKTVYGVLCLHVTGRALASVRLSQRFKGLEAWRLLVKEYESSASPDRSAAILAGLLAPA